MPEREKIRASPTFSKSDPTIMLSKSRATMGLSGPIKPDSAVRMMRQDPFPGHRRAFLPETNAIPVTK